MVPFLALLPPSLLRFRLSRPRHQPPCRSPSLASAFSLGMLLRYAHVTMSRIGRSSFFLAPKASASVSSFPSAFVFGRLLLLASLSTCRPVVGHRSGKVSGTPWQTSSRKANASWGGWRRLPHLATARSLRFACTLCACLAGHGLSARSAAAARPNPSVNRTPGKRRFACLPVPSRLRRSVAGYLER